VLEATDQSAAAATARYWRAPVSLADAMAAEPGPPEIAIAVYANHGRWIAECPDCREAQIASATDYRFMCNGCANVAVGGLWRAVVWPEEHAEIDAALSSRPRVHQNWLPGETLEDLVAEAQSAEGVD
jgi:hypothetical protein